MDYQIAKISDLTTHVAQKAVLAYEASAFSQTVT